MTQYFHSFKEFLKEAEDPTYYQETFSFTILISMSKEMGGSRDERAVSNAIWEPNIYLHLSFMYGGLKILTNDL